MTLLIYFVNNATQLVEKATLELNNKNKESWLAMVDEHLVTNSWDVTWNSMNDLIKEEIFNKQQSSTKKREVYV